MNASFVVLLAKAKVTDILFSSTGEGNTRSCNTCLTLSHDIELRKSQIAV